VVEESIKKDKKRAKYNIVSLNVSFKRAGLNLNISDVDSDVVKYYNIKCKNSYYKISILY